VAAVEENGLAGKPRVEEIHLIDTSTAEPGQPEPVRRRNRMDDGGGESSPAPSA